MGDAWARPRGGGGGGWSGGGGGGGGGGGSDTAARQEAAAQREARERRMRMLADVEAALADGDHAAAARGSVAVWDAGFSVPPVLQLQALSLAAKDGVDAFADALRVLCGADAPPHAALPAADGEKPAGALVPPGDTAPAPAAPADARERPRLALDLHSYARLLGDLLSAPAAGTAAMARLALNLALAPGGPPIPAYPADGDGGDGSDSEARAGAAGAGGAGGEADEQEDGEAAEAEASEESESSESEGEGEEGEAPVEVFFYGCAAAPELEGRWVLSIYLSV
jgi:hypothetical protein